jgi:hypothetical protein
MHHCKRPCIEVSGYVELCQRALPVADNAQELKQKYAVVRTRWVAPNLVLQFSQRSL